MSGVFSLVDWGVVGVLVVSVERVVPEVGPLVFFFDCE